MTSLDIIIVNWNSGNLLNECLRSVSQAATNNIKVAIYVIDNDSSDQSYVCALSYKHATLIKNERNVGFGAACNQGIKAGSGQYVLLLNPDVVIATSTLQDTIAFMEQNSDIAVMGARHVDEHGRTKVSCSTFPKLRRVINDTLGLSSVAPHVFKPAILMTYWDHCSSQFVDQVMGAYMCIKRNVLNRVGGFDEQFFVYYEDIDLSQRIIKSGGLVFYNAEVAIYHEGGGTTRQAKATRLLYYQQSRLQYYKKWFSPTKRAVASMFTLFVEPFSRTILYFFKLDWQSIKHTWVAFFRLYKSLLFTKNLPTNNNVS